MGGLLRSIPRRQEWYADSGWCNFFCFYRNHRIWHNSCLHGSIHKIYAPHQHEQRIPWFHENANPPFLCDHLHNSPVEDNRDGGRSNRIWCSRGHLKWSKERIDPQLDDLAEYFGYFVGFCGNNLWYNDDCVSDTAVQRGGTWSKDGSKSDSSSYSFWREPFGSGGESKEYLYRCARCTSRFWSISKFQ